VARASDQLRFTPLSSRIVWHILTVGTKHWHLEAQAEQAKGQANKEPFSVKFLHSKRMEDSDIEDEKRERES
jgi:hypothetical protein